MESALHVWDAMQTRDVRNDEQKGLKKERDFFPLCRLRGYRVRMRFKIQIPVNLSQACPQEKLKGTVALQIMENNIPFYLRETPYRKP